MLNERERRALEEIEQSLDARPAVRPEAERHTVDRVVARVGAGAALLLLVVGVPAAALSVGTAAALVWALWRYRHLLADTGSVAPADPQPPRVGLWRRGRVLVDHLRRMAEAER